jgi:hypothetical protein
MTDRPTRRSAFADRLRDGDIAEMVTKVMDTTDVFYGHFFGIFDGSDVDMEPLKIVMKVLQDMRDNGKSDKVAMLTA